ncbi:hypothetical protein STCU_12196 [Strigomonas culicis]|uniref:Kinesin motor domain-containing protein n=1 Tax=Strigomonas culicis TaxID=28005 RepID=S9TFY3_9TRYP|nr:hypothetical protein STCU_12196 [Strigomonas culicis]|eukprot:EPY15253.1 hypothetical protein STCU_12196 [Strigomonas culicis]
MLSNISPSTAHYEETLSTLRFADRAKSIVTRAFVNESAGDRRIRELENEVSRLRETIRLLQTQPSASPAPPATRQVRRATRRRACPRGSAAPSRPARRSTTTPTTWTAMSTRRSCMTIHRRVPQRPWRGWTATSSPVWT